MVPKLTIGESKLSPEEQLKIDQSIMINSNEKRFKANVDEAGISAKQTTDAIKNQGSIGTRFVKINQARNQIQLSAGYPNHEEKVHPSAQKQHLTEVTKHNTEFESDHSDKRRAFVNLSHIFANSIDVRELQSRPTPEIRWALAKETAKEMHHSTQHRVRFHLHHSRSDKKYGHSGSGRTDIATLLNAIESVSTKKNDLSRAIHPKDLIYLFGELLDQLKFEIHIRHNSRGLNGKLFKRDASFLPSFKYILEWFGEKLLACMIHLTLTIDSANVHTFNIDAVEQHVLHGIDRIIAMPIALTVGGAIGPIQVEKKVSKFLDKITDKLIQGKLDRRLLHFISIIEELYETLIHTFESSEFLSLLPARGGVR